MFAVAISFFGLLEVAVFDVLVYEDTEELGIEEESGRRNEVFSPP